MPEEISTYNKEQARDQFLDCLQKLKLTNYSLYEKIYNIETSPVDEVAFRNIRVSEKFPRSMLAYTESKNDGTIVDRYSKPGKVLSKFWGGDSNGGSESERFTKDLIAVINGTICADEIGNSTILEKIAIGEEIVDAYCDDPPWGRGSCMTIHSQGGMRKQVSRILRLYAENPEKCSLYLFRHKAEEWTSRCLVWLLDDGQTKRHDRIYLPEDTSETEYRKRDSIIREYFLLHGIKEVFDGDKITLNRPSNDNFPYMDRFYLGKFIDHEKVLMAHRGRGSYNLEFTCTNGDYEGSDSCYCEFCNERFNEDDLTETNDGLCCGDCYEKKGFYQCNRCDGHLLKEDMFKVQMGGKFDTCYFCQECFNAIDTFVCNECDKIFSLRFYEKHVLRCTEVCDDCFKNVGFVCESCNQDHCKDDNENYAGLICNKCSEDN